MNALVPLLHQALGNSVVVVVMVWWWCLLGSEDTNSDQDKPQMAPVSPSDLCLSGVPVSGPEPGRLLLLPALGFLPPEHFSGSLTMAETGVCWSPHAHHQHRGGAR